MTFKTIKLTAKIVHSDFYILTNMHFISNIPQIIHKQAATHIHNGL